MGTIAARKTRRAIDHLFRLLAIDAMVMGQAVELRAADGRQFGVGTKSAIAWLRQSVPALVDDRPLGNEIESLALRLRQSDGPEVNGCQ